MLSRTTKYGLRAAGHLARVDPDGAKRTSLGEIAEALDVPRNYLSKVLHRMAQAGILRSTRGPAGGFALAFPAHELTLAEITAPFNETGGPLPCLLQDRPCDPLEPCVAHERWKGLATELRAFFAETTIGELVASPSEVPKTLSEDTNVLP